MRLFHVPARQAAAVAPAASLAPAASVPAGPAAAPRDMPGDRSMRVFELAVAGIAIVVAVLVSFAR